MSDRRIERKGFSSLSSSSQAHEQLNMFCLLLVGKPSQAMIDANWEGYFSPSCKLIVRRRSPHCDYVWSLIEEIDDARRCLKWNNACTHRDEEKWVLIKDFSRETTWLKAISNKNLNNDETFLWAIRFSFSDSLLSQGVFIPTPDFSSFRWRDNYSRDFNARILPAVKVERQVENWLHCKHTT